MGRVPKGHSIETSYSQTLGDIERDPKVSALQNGNPAPGCEDVAAVHAIRFSSFSFSYFFFFGVSLLLLLSPLGIHTGKGVFGAIALYCSIKRKGLGKCGMKDEMSRGLRLFRPAARDNGRILRDELLFQTHERNGRLSSFRAGHATFPSLIFEVLVLYFVCRLGGVGSIILPPLILPNFTAKIRKKYLSGILLFEKKKDL